MGTAGQAGTSTSTTGIEHSSRAHALLSASASHRWMSCTAAPLLEDKFPNKSSVAAEEGTLAHELAEGKLRNRFLPDTFSGRKLSALRKKLKANELWDDEMEGFTDDYVDGIRKMSLAYERSPIIYPETRLDLSKYVPNGFGTADCIMVTPDTIHVVDLKYGKGVPVSAFKNPQMMLYALGAYEKFRVLYRFSKVKMSIIQPRLNTEPDTYECSMEELLAFGELAKQKAAEALSGNGVYHPDTENCRFCRAAARCRARAEYNTQMLEVSKSDVSLLTDEEVGKYIQLGSDISKWVECLKEYALETCLAGGSIPGFKAVLGRSSRTWNNMDEAFKKLNELGYPDEILYERKALTLAQVEKVVGKKQMSELEGAYWHKEDGKPTLVVETDKREAYDNRTRLKEAFGDM